MMTAYLDRSEDKKLLILGGTADGRHLASALHASGCSIIYSVAGLVRIPDLACEVISGGFTQFGGLSAYIREHKIQAILDVTHPYAQKMSKSALKSAQQCMIPCWRFHRLAWQPEKGDHWQEFNAWPALVESLKDKKSVFLTAGQVPESVLETLQQYGDQGQVQILRTAVKPKEVLPASIQWHKAIGPFALEDELALMQHHKVDVLVSKNSGGNSTQAKLSAARTLGISVFMFTRPEILPADKEFIERDQCQTFIERWFKKEIEEQA